MIVSMITMTYSYYLMYYFKLNMIQFATSIPARNPIAKNVRPLTNLSGCLGNSNKLIYCRPHFINQST